MRELVVADPATGGTVGRRRLLSPILTVAVAMAVLLQLQSPPARADSARVRLQDGRFDPERIDVSVGDTVVWKAKDDRHTVTARTGEFDSSGSGLMYDGDEFRWRFTRAGVYPYFCRVRQYEGMQGEVVVLGDPADQGAASSSTTTSTPPAPPETPATAPSTTATTAQPSTPTTHRPLVTSSTVNLATTTTGPFTVPVSPHEPPSIDLDVVRGAPPQASGIPPEASVAGTPAALRHQRGTTRHSPSRLALIIGLAAAAGGTLAVSRRRRRRRPRRPSG